MDTSQSTEKIYCIFNNDKEILNNKLEKAFEIYLKELTQYNALEKKTKNS